LFSGGKGGGEGESDFPELAGQYLDLKRGRKRETYESFRKTVS